MPGELLTLWTARLAVVCWAARVLVEAGGSPSPRRELGSRLFWLLGSLAFLWHVAAAFEFYHGWSHRTAMDHTARRTAEVIGLNWGGGVYFNYVALLVWPADALLAWRPAAGSMGAARRRFRRFAFGYVTFLMVNATVVFGPAFWKPAGAAFAVAWMLLRPARLREPSAADGLEHGQLDSHRLRLPLEDFRPHDSHVAGRLDSQPDLASRDLQNSDRDAAVDHN
jgi:hypothetical protein